MKLKEDEHLDFVLRYYQKGKLDTQKAFRVFRNKYTANISIRPYRYKYAVAAAVILIISLFTGVLYKWMQPSADWVILSSGNQVKEIRLPDSTIVTLAPASSIRYEANTFPGKRDVEMQGKAFFQVKRNPQFPFSVKNDRAIVKVLGTKFQLAHTDSATSVWVQSGKVSFSCSEGRESLVLTQGMSAILASHSLIPERIEQKMPNITAWQSGYFVYDNTPLETVLRELSHYYGVKLSATEKSKSLTGRFPTDNLDEIIEIIESTLGIKIEKSFN
ncbi:MAG: DUF4974 domain-containing protein [Odoribacter splanchnicus]|nr:DUF4974 domain-containing protein [Odoribacter splanchnicus]